MPAPEATTCRAEDMVDSLVFHKAIPSGAWVPPREPCAEQATYLVTDHVIAAGMTTWLSREACAGHAAVLLRLRPEVARAHPISP